MHARLFEVSIKQGQSKEFLRTLVEKDLPVMKEQQGFVDALALTPENERDKFVGLSIWKTKEDADRFVNGPGKQLMQAVTPLIQHESQVRSFNLEASTAHRIGLAQAAGSR